MMDEIIEKIKLKLGDLEIQPELLAATANEMICRILNYLNCEELPKGLYECTSAMCCDLLRHRGISQGEEMLRGIRMGDTTIDYFESGLSGEMDRMLMGYSADLHAYRQIRW